MIKRQEEKKILLLELAIFGAKNGSCSLYSFQLYLSFLHLYQCKSEDLPQSPLVVIQELVHV